MSLITAAHPNALSSSRVLIIGGTSGIGAAVASGALGRAAKVHVSSSSTGRVASTIEKLKSLYPSATITGSAADLSDINTIDANLESVVKSAVHELGGPLDHIVYTAGEPPAITALATVTGPTAFNGWTVRYVGPLIIAKLVAANPGTYLKAEASSSITLTGGTLASRPRPGVSASIGIAGATETLARSLALELAPIRSNIVVLGPVRTELLATFPQQVLDAFSARTVNKTMGKPEDAAEAYLFAMSSGFTTGQEIVVDGGSMVNGA